MQDVWRKIVDFIQSTHIAQQISDVDAAALFTNPWFIVPLVGILVYMIYKQSWKDLLILAIFVVVWWVSGTDYMASLLVDGEIQIEKILPVVFGGAALLGFVIYLLFGRSD